MLYADDPADRALARTLLSRAVVDHDELRVAAEKRLVLIVQRGVAAAFK